MLRVTGTPAAPILEPQPDATWGLHLADVNIALGNLVDIVRMQADVGAQTNPRG